MTRRRVLAAFYTIAIAAMVAAAWMAGTTARHYTPPSPCPPTAIPSQYQPHIYCGTKGP